MQCGLRTPGGVFQKTSRRNCQCLQAHIQTPARQYQHMLLAKQLLRFLEAQEGKENTRSAVKGLPACVWLFVTRCLRVAWKLCVHMHSPTSAADIWWVTIGVL